MAAPPTRRRWFQFSLGTMFLLVTISAVLLGWLVSERRFVQERKAASRDKAAIVISVTWGKREQGWWAPGSREEKIFPETTIPFWRTWMGDQAMAFVRVDYPYSEEQLSELHRLFPEARDFQMAK